MPSAPFVIEQLLNAPPAVVWKAITEKTEMKQWHFDLAEFKPVVGFQFQFYGEGRKGEKYLHICKIAEGDKTRLKLTHEGLETFPADNPDFAKESFAEGWAYIIGTSLKKYTDTTEP